MKRRKTGALTLGVSGLLASAMMTGCTPSGDVIDADYAKVCRDKNEIRVEDSHCSDQGRSGGYYGWYFYQMSSGARSVPAIGSRATGGSVSVPAGKSVRGGVGSKGGTVSRGGFGTTAKGGSFGG